jgi:hypothetical protein
MQPFMIVALVGATVVFVALAALACGLVLLCAALS